MKYEIVAYRRDNERVAVTFPIPARLWYMGLWPHLMASSEDEERLLCYPISRHNVSKVLAPLASEYDWFLEPVGAEQAGEG